MGRPIGFPSRPPSPEPRNLRLAAEHAAAVFDMSTAAHEAIAELGVCTQQLQLIPLARPSTPGTRALELATLVGRLSVQLELLDRTRTFVARVQEVARVRAIEAERLALADPRASAAEAVEERGGLGDLRDRDAA